VPPATLSRRTRYLPKCIRRPLRGKRVVVQRYGETNRELQATLERNGADVTEIVTYRWGLPEDTAPLLRLIDALGRDEIDLVAFTSASQASNLFTVAQYDGKQQSLKQSLWPNARRFNRPGSSAALRKLGVRVDIEAHPQKLGPLIDAINTATVRPVLIGQILTIGGGEEIGTVTLARWAFSAKRWMKKALVTAFIAATVFPQLVFVTFRARARSAPACCHSNRRLSTEW